MDKIRDLFSAIAPKYDLLNTVLSVGTDRLWRRRGVAYLKGRKKIFDLCAGTLALTKELLKVNPECQVTAVDFSREMLESGLASLPEHFRSKVKTVCSDFYKFEQENLSFDAMMCAYGLRNLQDNPAALKKIYHLLSPGGRFVILEFFRPDRWYTWAWNLTYAQWVIPFIGSLISRHRGAYQHLRNSVRGFYALDEYTALLQKTGFQIVVAQRMSGGISGLIVAEKR